MRRLPVLSVAALGFLSACVRADAAPERSTAADAASPRQLPTVVVYKSPTCGCCEGWIEHLRAAGFQVDARDVPEYAELLKVKADAEVPNQLQTCHTALVDGYVVEGHVPVEQIKRLLADRPDVVGIAVPGMPMGSPGMEGPSAEPYRVYSWNRDGSGQVYAEIDPR